MSKTIYFVRHGESVANLQGLIAGSRSDTPLTIKGEEQALKAALLLKDLPIESIISSPLQRAGRTAQIIADSIGYKGKIINEPLLTERDFGSVTGLPREQALQTIEVGTATDVESYGDLYERARLAVAYLKSCPGRYILVVSHAAFGRMLKVFLAGDTYDNFSQYPKFANTEIYEFELED